MSHSLDFYSSWAGIVAVAFALVFGFSLPVAAQTPFPKRISLPTQYGALWQYGSLHGFGGTSDTAYFFYATSTEASYTVSGAYVAAPKRTIAQSGVTVSPALDPQRVVAIDISVSDTAFGVFNSANLSPIFQYRTGLGSSRSHVVSKPFEMGFIVVLDRNETIEVISLDGNGAQIWAKRLSSQRFGIPNRDLSQVGFQYATSAPMPDGGILLSVRKTFFSPEAEESLLIRLSSQGVLMWAKQHDESITASTYDFEHDSLLLQESKEGGISAKLDASGNVLWSKRLASGKLSMFARNGEKTYIRVDPAESSATNRFAILSANGAVESQVAFTVEGADEGVYPVAVSGSFVWFVELSITREKPTIGWVDMSAKTTGARRYEKVVDSTSLSADGLGGQVVASFFSKQDQAIDVIPLNSDFVVNVPCALFTQVAAPSVAGDINLIDAALNLPALAVTSTDYVHSFVAANIAVGSTTIESITLNESSVCTANTEPPFPKPSLEATPEDGKVEIGGFAFLFASGPLGLSPTWQWKHNGQVIVGETNAFYSINSMTKEKAGVYTVVMTSGGNSSEESITITVPSALTFTLSPQSQIVPVASAVTLGATASTTALGETVTYQWYFNGNAVAGATGATLTLPSMGPASVGAYTVVATAGAEKITSVPAVVGLQTATKALGSVYEFAADIKHANGNTYDQFLLTGVAGTITADPGQIARVSFLDVNDDIVQLEFSGPGVLTIQMANATGPATPTKYVQPTVQYMRGRVSLTLTGATDNTNLGIYTVGTATNPNPALYVAGSTYDGFADLGSITVHSPNNRFAGVRLGSTRLSAETGNVGVIAPGIRFGGPLNVHNVAASGTASPYLLTGSIDTGRISITGGDMLQPNAQPVVFGTASQVAMVAGSSSHGVLTPAKVNRGKYERDGLDVTASVVLNPQ